MLVLLRRRQVKRFLALVAVLVVLIVGTAYLRQQGYGPRLQGATHIPGAETPPAPSDSTPVVSPTFTPGASLAEARMERERVRGQQIEMLEKLVASPATTPEVKAQAERQMLSIITAMGHETEIEGVLRSKGYLDALAYVHEGGATVVVSQELAQQDATRIADAVCRTTGYRAEAVTIVAPPSRP